MFKANNQINVILKYFVSDGPQPIYLVMQLGFLKISQFYGMYFFYSEFVLLYVFCSRDLPRTFINIVGFKMLKIPTQVDRFESVCGKRFCAAGPLRSWVLCLYIFILIYPAAIIILYSILCTSTQHVDNTIGALLFIIMIYSCYSQRIVVPRARRAISTEHNISFAQRNSTTSHY